MRMINWHLDIFPCVFKVYFLMSLFPGICKPGREMGKWKEETHQKQSGLLPLLEVYSVIKY